MGNKIYFITGASGVGKTTLVETLAQKLPTGTYKFSHFDSVGIPSSEEFKEMERQGINWQRSATLTWIKKLVKDAESQTVIFEGQTNLDYIEEGFAKQNFKNYEIVLLDCPEAEMNRRLIEERNQPDLANPQMANWRKHLRNQAVEKKARIVDTSKQSLAETADLFIELALKA